MREGWHVWALCEQSDRGRLVKGSIPALIIDKYKGVESKRERAEEGERHESGGVSTCNSIFLVSKVKSVVNIRGPHTQVLLPNITARGM